jgi:MFS family permease
MTSEPMSQGTTTETRGWLSSWKILRSRAVVDVLELQPLQESYENRTSTSQRSSSYIPDSTVIIAAAVNTSQLHISSSATPSATSEYRTLDRILGLDEPITLRCHGTVGAVTNSDTACFGTSTTTSSYVEEFFYPSDIPPALQLWRYRNICIPISYLAVGIMQGMLRPLLNVYPIDLGATEAQQTMIASIATLPSALKIIFGFVSDNVPIYGYRRKPYMLLGWILTIGSMIVLLYCTNLSVPNGTESSTTNTSYQSNRDLPSIGWLMVTFFLSGSGMWISDVMADAFVAQKVPQEPVPAQGQIQSTCYACRFFGIAAFAPVSTYLYNNGLFGYPGPTTIVTILAIAPLVTAFPLWFWLEEERYVPAPSTKDQCREIWNTICSRAVWQPIGFVYLYNILQVPNAAWRQYLKSVLLFTSDQLNVLLTVSYFLLYIGTVVYKYCYIKSSWRRIYYFGFTLNVIASLGQLALIRGYTFGISPFFFALGDDAIVEFIMGLQMLPICILMVTLCPPNSLGTSYAMFTTSWNSAMLLSQAIGSSLLGIWDTSKETMMAGNVDGLFKLALLTTFLQMCPIVFVWWLPHGRTDLEALAHGRDDSGSRNGSSKIGGGIFLFIVISSVLYTVVVTLLNVLVPGWMGEK